jgi:ribosomal protein L29
MADKKDLLNDVENAKMEYMKIRFRVALGEEIKAHEIRAAKRKISDAVRALNSGNEK